MFLKKNKAQIVGNPFLVFGIYDSVDKIFVTERFFAESVEGAKRAFSTFLDPINPQTNKLIPRAYKAGTFLLCEFTDFKGSAYAICDDTQVHYTDYLNEPQAEPVKE